MTKTDLFAALAARPRPFPVGDGEVLLRPLRVGDRMELMKWYAANKSAEGFGDQLQRKLAALGLCDQSGAAVVSEAEVDSLDATLIDEVANEVARRSGLRSEDPAAGKAASPATPS